MLKLDFQSDICRTCGNIFLASLKKVLRKLLTSSCCALFGLIPKGWWLPIRAYGTFNDICLGCSIRCFILAANHAHYFPFRVRYQPGSLQNQRVSGTLMGLSICCFLFVYLSISIYIYIDTYTYTCTYIYISLTHNRFLTDCLTVFFFFSLSLSLSLSLFLTFSLSLFSLSLFLSVSPLSISMPTHFPHFVKPFVQVCLLFVLFSHINISSYTRIMIFHHHISSQVHNSSSQKFIIIYRSNSSTPWWWWSSSSSPSSSSSWLRCRTRAIAVPSSC